MEQSYHNWILLIVDDGSNDATLEQMRGFTDTRIVIIPKLEPKGLAFRLNQLIDESTGDFIARMDGDDIAHPHRLLKQVEYLENHRDVDLLGTSVMVFNSKNGLLGKRSFPQSHGEITRNAISGFPMAHPTYMGTRDFFRRFRYDPRLRKAQDQDLLLRAYRTSQFSNLPDLLLAYRENDTSLSKQIQSRTYRVRSVVPQLIAQGAPGKAIEFTAKEVAKLAMEGLAIATNKEEKLLRHRASRATAEEVREWEDVMRLLHLQRKS